MLIEVFLDRTYWRHGKATNIPVGVHEIVERSVYDDYELGPYDASILVRMGCARVVEHKSPGWAVTA